MESLKKTRVRILYVIALVLIGASVVPLWFYGSMMMSTNRENLETQEKLLQTMTSQSLSQVTSLYVENLNQQLKEFLDAVGPLATRTATANYPTDSALRVALENFVTDRPSVLDATVLNDQAQGVRAGNFNAAAEPFLRNALAEAHLAARQGISYRSNPITLVRSGTNEPVMVMAEPIQRGNQFLGMVGAVVTLRPLSEQLQDTYRRSGLEAYIVDSGGRLVASYDPDKVAGTEMTAIPIVQKYRDYGRAPVAETSLFQLQQGNQMVPMLGTYTPTQKIGWGVIVQRKISEAYFLVTEMRRRTFQWGLLLVLLSVAVAFLAAKSITRPIDALAQTARSIAQRDFSQRAEVRSRTEIGELAETFNDMAADIQGYIHNLQTASEQNHRLFMDSIEMIAAAVDAKDRHTIGHSRRVAEISVILARELGLPEEEVNKIRVSAILHDVGKIGIEDRVLNKPGELTAEERETMQRHTVMGYEIVRQVKQLAEMLPGIRWHHESLNGQGYPDGLTGDELPLMVRILAVADTFEAMTTKRFYQRRYEPPEVLEYLRQHAGTKYDPIVVDAMEHAFRKGSLAKLETRHREPTPVEAA